jgi:hypothetical protein
VCGKDYTTTDSDIIGINPIPITNYGECLDLCVTQGTACNGITVSTFGGSDLKCHLKKNMQPSSTAPSYVADSAVRLTGPAGASTQLITNGGFDTGDFTSWTYYLSNAKSSISIVNGVASVYPYLHQPMALSH